MSDRPEIETQTYTGPDRRLRTERREREAGGEASTHVRIAAVGDFHIGEEERGRFRTSFTRANEEADVLLLAGDLTHRGTVPEIEAVLSELVDVHIPIVAVLGNHDCESGQEEELSHLLRERGIHLLDGETFELDDDVSIAGAKGFMGGYGRHTLTSFGEAATKAFVQELLEESRKLEMALLRSPGPLRIALLHYAPILETVLGEPEAILPFLGSDRLAEPLDRYEVSVCFHGHAHRGSFQGTTTGGVPVFNVSLPLLREEGRGDPYFLFHLPRPRKGEAEAGEAPRAERAGTPG